MSENWSKVTKSLSYLVVNRKWFLWTALIVGGFFFLNKRYTSVNGLFKTVDVIILLFWISLIIMPFFQEINFYGLKLKKEIDELKFDINRQFIDLSKEFIILRSEINNSNENHSQLTSTVVFPPLSDSQLSKREGIDRQILEETLEAWGIKKPSNESELTKAPDDVLYLFSVRYQIEKELKRVFNEISPISNEISHNNNFRHLPTSRMVEYLKRLDYIDSNVANIIMQILGITNRAIHGEDISKGQFNFVHGTAPDLIAILKGIT
ncbi:hypothetical protein FXW07_05930 [Methanosarcina sp. DH1]|uniref:hypothetical protein n=1 Tax=Methanosarcina sp. DH1 TaxID=2605695 RepID=UPI001E29A37E|nr:hypothetical protein [Methanosarcina sp. DH1]MCC4766165.1 hypothetical protein [Methanosarcina sp. DH1]